MKHVPIGELGSRPESLSAGGKYSISSIQFSRKITLRSPFAHFPPPVPLPPPLARWRHYRRRRWRRNDGGTTEERNKLDRREGGGCRFGYGFRKRRRILFLRKPDKRPFTRVFLAHASRGQRDREGFSIAGKQISARQISVSLSRDKRSPRVPRIFHSLSLSLSPFLLKLSKPIQTIFADRIFPDILCSKIRSNGADLRSTYLPTPPLDRPLYFFRRGIFFFDLLRRGCRSGRAKGRRSTRRGCTEGDSSVYLRIACRLSIEPFVQPRVKSLRIDSKIRSRSSVVRKRCGVTNDKNLYFYLRREKKGKRGGERMARGEGRGVESNPWNPRWKSGRIKPR